MASSILSIMLFEILIFLVSFCVRFYISWRSCVFNSLCVALKFSPKIAFCCSICVNAYRRPLACLGSCWLLWMFVQGLYHAPSCNCFLLLPFFFGKRCPFLWGILNATTTKFNFILNQQFQFQILWIFFNNVVGALKLVWYPTLCFVPWNQSLLFIFLLKCLILFLML